MKNKNLKLEALTKLVKGNNNRIKRASFNSKNGFYLFVLAGSYACSSSDGNDNSSNNISSLNFVGSDLVDFLGDSSSTSKQIVDGDGGNDVIITGAGDDVIRGGQGSDFISTGAGNDTILIIGTTATDEYSSAEIDTSLAGVLSLETLNGNIVDEAASDIIDGGDDIDTLVIYGTTDLTGTTITNIENISVHSTVTVDENTFDGSGVVLRGDGSSALVIQGDVSLTDILGEVKDFSGFASLEIGDGATVIVESQDEVDLLAEIGVVSGSGTLTINGTESLNLSEVTVVTGFLVNGSHTNLSDVLIINGTFSLEEGSMTNINTDGVNLAGASTTTVGFSIDGNGQLLMTDTSLTGRQLVSIDIEGVIVTYAIVLPDLDRAPTQADFDGITFDELDEGVSLNLSDALSSALLNLDSVFVLTKATASNGTVDGFSYNSGEFSGTDIVTFSLTNIVTGEEFDFTVDLAITAVNDEGIIQIAGNRQQGETLTADLIDRDGELIDVTYAWLQGDILGGESSFNIGSSTDDLELIITYRDAVNPSIDQTATITIAADDILAEDIDTQIALNLDADSTAGIVILEDSNNSDSFLGLNDIGDSVNITTTLAYTTATISLVDDGSGGEQINFEYIIDSNNSDYIALAEGEELVDSITLTTREGVSLVREFTVVGENDIASFSSGNILTVNDTFGVDQGTAETQNYVISDADGIEQENLILDFGVIATSGTLDGEAIVSEDLAAYGTLNVNSITNELSFLKGERVDALEVNEAVVLTFSVKSIGQTALPVTVRINGANDEPVIVNEEVTIEEDFGLVVISVLDNDSDAEGNALTVTEVTGANNGTVSINDRNQLEYIADADFFGTETLSYIVSDGASTQTGTVRVSVTPVNDRGELTLGSSSVGQGAVLSVTLTDVDGIDGADVTLSLVDDNGDLITDFTPIIVQGLGNTLTTTVVVPTSVAVDSEIVVRASYTDAGGVAYGTLAPFISSESLTVSPNIPPVIGGIVPTDITVIEDMASSVDLSSVDFSDSDSDNLTVSLTANSGTFIATSSGEVTVGGSGSETLTLTGSTSELNNYLDVTSNIEYTGGSDIEGENVASFTIVANDGTIASSIRTINLDINPVNDAPVALDTQTATISEDSLLTVSPNANDVDLDILTLTIDNVTNGTATVDVNGDIIFTPTADFNGEAIISYTASDDSVSDTGIITVTVTAENDAPVALDTQTATISEDSLLTVSPNASDVDLDILTLTVDNVSNGTATVDVNGDIVFTPTADFNGEAIISYTASDDSVSDTGIITVTVTAENDAGVLEITGGSGAPDTELSFSLTDVDGIEGQEITVSLLDNNGEVIGTPVMVLGLGDTATGKILVPTDVVEGEPISLRAGYEDDGATVYNGGVDGGNPFISSEAITVSVNEAPTAVNDIRSIDEDALSPVLIDVLANDSDQEGQTLTVTQVTGDDNGTATIVGNQISYIANADFSGIETLTYTLSDSVGATNIAEVSITVNGINDAPVALDNQTATISEDSLLTVSPNANDVDLDILTLTIDNVSNGTATVDVNGDIVFTPTADFNGEAIISYTASDDSVSDTGIITVTVTAENDAPVALDTQTATISEDSLLTVSPNASDVDLDILTLTVDNVSNGIATVDVNGDIVFTPTADFNGEAIISYTASDDSVSDTGIITVTVTAENDTGVLEITGGSGAPDTELSFSLTDVDGIDGQEITVSLLDNNGEVIGTPVMVLGLGDTATGTILVPTDVVEGEPISLRAGYEDDGATVYNGGVDGGNPFISSEAITVSANEAPTAVNDIRSIDEDALSPVLIDVLANDSDQEGQTLTVTQVTGDDNGTATIVGNQISYIANADFSGIETLTYTLSDSVGATNIAEVSITVNGINDAPVALDTQTATISEDSLLTVSPNASDVDLDILTLTVDNVSNGIATVDVNGDIVFTPTADFNGEAIISYTASDESVSDTGIITVTVTAENDAPVALDDQTATISEDSLLTVSPNASDVDLDILTLTVDNVSNGTATVDVNGDIVFTPTADFNGEAIISYTASDDSVSDTGIITVTVTAENDAGVLVITGGSGAPETELSFILTDVDGINGQEITVSLLDSDANVIGTAVTSIGGGDTLIGTILVPMDVVEGDLISLRAGYEDEDATVYNGEVDGGRPFVTSDVITVSVNVAPMAVADVIMIDEDTLSPIVIDVLGNDSDAEGQMLTVTQVTGDDNGTATIIDNQISYIANADFSGLETLTYTLSDSVGATNIAEILITVNGINDAPVALDDQTATISEDSFLTVSPNASDVDLDILTLMVDNVSNGTATVDVDGNIVFTPTTDFNGEAIISYTASDESVSDTGIITVTVTAENDTPVALDTQTATISEDSLLTVSPNASDVDLDILTLTVDNVSNGTATVDVNGDIVFTPTADFNGEAIISYTASDESVSDTGIITVTVTAENDAGVLEITGGSGAPDTELSFSLTDVDGIDGQEITVSLLDNNGEVIGTPVMVLGLGDTATGTILVPTDVVEGEPISLRAGYEDDGATVYNGGVDGGNPFISSEAITVSANEAPTAVNDIGSIDEDALSPVLIDVLANDSDQEAQTLTVTQVTGDDNGTATIVGNQISYIANADFSGIETLTYTLSDSVGATNIAEVSITVNAINDAPVALDNQTATISEDSLLTVSPNASDVDLDILTLTVDNVSNGTATVDVNGDIVFTPTADFNGEAIISYTASDESVSDTGIITVTVTAENDAGVLEITGGSGAPDTELSFSLTDVDGIDGQEITVSLLDNNGEVIGTPVMVLGLGDTATGTILVPTDVVEGEPISLRAGYEDDGATVYNGGVDGGNPFISSEAITVSSNEAPTAVNDIGSIDEDALSPVLIDVLANDSDAEGQTLTVTQVTGDDNGTATIVGNQISYIANADFSGIETLTYTLSDSVGATNIAEVSITVNAINDAPVGLDDQTATMLEDSLLTVSPNASDVDGDILTLTIDNVSNGTATVDVNGDIVFTPTADFNGEALISYTAGDGSLSDTGLITVTVTAVNDAPVISGELGRDIVVFEDSPSGLDLFFLEFSDIEGDNLTVTFTASSGTFIGTTGVSGVTVGGSGVILTLSGSSNDINSYLDTQSHVRYRGENNLSGNNVANFTIVANDGMVDSSTRTVNVDITLMNDDPIIGGTIPTEITIIEDTSTNIDLSALEITDIDNTFLLFSLTVSSGTFTTADKGEFSSLEINNFGSRFNIFGRISDINGYLDDSSNIEYTGASNIFGEDSASFTIVAFDEDDFNVESSTSTVNINIIGVNDAPVIGGTIPTDITAIEDILNNIDLSGLVFTDVDGDNLTVTLTASAGTFAGATGVNGVTVNGNGTSVLTLLGIANDINSYLDIVSNIGYTGASNVNGEEIASFMIVVNDGTVDSFTSIVNLDITAVNDAPVIGGIPTDITVIEDTASEFDLSGVIFSDVEDESLIVILTVDTGTFAAISSGGVTVEGSGESILILSGSIVDIHTYLDTTSNIEYTGESDVSGENAVSFTITAIDEMDSSTSTINLDITAVNDAPVIGGTIPTHITVIEDILSNIDLSAVVFSDADVDENLVVALTADTGTFAATSSGGVTVGGSGVMLTLSGSASDINNYLDVVSNIQYTGASNIFGEEVASFTLVANDGTIESSTSTINLDITAVNDAAPTIGGIPTDITVIEDTASNIDLSLVEFADSEDDNLRVTLTASAGIFLGTTGIVGVTVDGTGTSALVLSGSASDINGYLDDLSHIQYTGPSNVNGENAASFTIVANDGVIDSLVSEVSVYITAVNDAPILVGNAPILSAHKNSPINIDLRNLFFSDVDGDNIIVTLSTTGGNLVGAEGTSGGVSVGVGASILILSGSASDINSYLDVGSNLRYTKQEDIGSITIVASDGVLKSSERTIDIGAVFNGTNGVDTIEGTEHADNIKGSAGADTLTGGAGEDTFVYSDIDVGLVNIDTITDFVSGEDRLSLSGITGIFSKDTTSRGSPIENGGAILSNFTFYNNSSGTSTLYIDANDDQIFNIENDIQIDFSNGVSLSVGDYLLF